MSHKSLLDTIRRTIRLGQACNQEGLSPASAIARDEERAERRSRLRRRTLLGGAAAIGALAVDTRLARAVPRGGSRARIAVIGAGLAGLACADRLRAFGLSAVVYDSSDRVGGRCYSNRTTFPGQVAENGGELIDNGHKTLLGYAQEFGLAREDLAKEPGETFYHFYGALYGEAEVVDEMRVLAGRMHDDVHRLSAAPDAFSHTEDDVFFDQMSLAEWLQSRASDVPLARAAIEAAYVGEYGREMHEQSSLNFLLYMRSDRRSKLELFGSSDERFHIVDGNDRIAQHIAARLPGPVELQTRVSGLRRLATGEYAIRFSGSTTEDIFDAVVVAVPFSVLRTWSLDASLGIPAVQMSAIQQFQLGHNAKLLVGFDQRPWASLASSGSSYADLPNLQNTWETSYTTAQGHAVLTSYLGGDLALGVQQPLVNGSFSCSTCHTGAPSARVIHDEVIQDDVDAFLADLELVYPGAQAAVSRLAGGGVRSFLAHWDNQSTTRGSYTCYGPGAFTTIAGLEAEPVDHLHFAGEHTDSFYWYQGFMEGAARSGIRAADEILEAIKHGEL